MENSLMNVYWIGGSPCSGKSTTARKLAQEHGCTLYSADEHFQEHLKRATTQDQPLWVRLRGMSWDEIWMRPLEIMVEEELEYYRQEWPLILEDLAALPAERPVLAEGTSLIPECVQQVLADPRRAVWMVPTEDFQRHHYPRRGDWVQGILDQCSTPEQAFRNWMDRDVEFGRRVARQAREAGLKLIIVDRSTSLEENARAVERMLFQV